ncbi:MAG: dTMP kinase [Candidatus Saccharibacteria bacterium]|nr:dTMP kinase [Candidatus Saccharibacteria bacterium]
MHIVIEGQDATGKDTQAQLLADYLRSKGQNVVHYSESGTASEDPFVQKIAKLNYGTKQDIDHRTRVLLYLINRYEQWRKLAEPTLKNGDTVITTRNWYSTLIYEGYAGGVSRNLIRHIHKEVMPERYFSPDKIVILTLSDEDRAKRLADQASKTGRVGEVFKSKGDSFQHKLNSAYLKVAKDENIPTLDTAGTVEEVHEKLKKLFKL